MHYLENHWLRLSWRSDLPVIFEPKGCSCWNLCSGSPGGIFTLLCVTISSICLFFLIYVRLFPLTFLSGTVVRINLLYASCFFTSGPEDKLLLPAEKEKKETGLSLFQTCQPTGNEGNALSRHIRTHTHTHTHTHTRTQFFHTELAVSPTVYYYLIWLISRELGDNSKLTSSALGCNISMAQM